jgi:hypothetical protein
MIKSINVKIRVTVPVEHARNVKKALGEAGAGKLGNYDHCLVSYPVQGQFRPLKDAHPALGKVGKLEQVKEMMIEAVCPKKKLKSVIMALKKAHPYEEPAIDVVELMNYELRIMN